MSHTILVTGATGRVGSEVVKALAGSTHRVRIAARGEKAAAMRRAGFETVEMDFRSPESINAAMQDVDRAFLLTPVTPEMVELGNAFVAAAKQAGVKRIVRLSGAYAETKANQLARWHRQVEEAIEASGMAYTFVRPTPFMQNYARLAQSIKAEGVYHLPHGDAKVAMVDARDVAAVAARALDQDGHEGRAYTVTGPAAISDHEVAEILSGVLGTKVTYLDLPEEAAYRNMLGTGMPEVLASVRVELLRMEREGHVAAVSPAVEQVTGRPARTFAEFAKDYAAVFK